MVSFEFFIPCLHFSEFVEGKFSIISCLISFMVPSADKASSLVNVVELSSGDFSLKEFTTLLNNLLRLSLVYTLHICIQYVALI